LMKIGINFNWNKWKKRSIIRIKDNRPTPIDILYNNLQPSLPLIPDAYNPTYIFKLYPLQEILKLQTEINIYCRLPHSDASQFWTSFSEACECEVQEIKKLQNKERDGYPLSVKNEIVDLLSGKSYSELEELHETINNDLESGTAVDVEYWENLLKELLIYKSKALAIENYVNIIERKINVLPSDEQKNMRQRFREEEEKKLI